MFGKKRKKVIIYWYCLSLKPSLLSSIVLLSLSRSPQTMSIFCAIGSHIQKGEIRNQVREIVTVSGWFFLMSLSCVACLWLLLKLTSIMLLTGAEIREQLDYSGSVMSTSLIHCGVLPYSIKLKIKDVRVLANAVLHWSLLIIFACGIN